MYSFSIRQFIWEYIGVFFGGKFLLCNRFQLGNSFGTYVFFFFFFGGGEVPLCIRFQLGNSFGNT